MSYNRVVLLGNLTRDPELRYTPSNTAVAKFSIAVNEKWKDKSGELKEDVLFIECTIFGARAAPFCNFHKKGSPCFIEGKLRLERWEDKNGGGKRQKHSINVLNWEFVGPGEPNENSENAKMQHENMPEESESPF